MSMAMIVMVIMTMCVAIVPIIMLALRDQKRKNAMNVALSWQ